MELMRKRSGRSISSCIVGATRSIASRVRTAGLLLLEIAAVIAMAVSEFLDKSPMKSEASASKTERSSSADFLKEPESVAGRKVIFDKGGILFCSADGSKMLRVLMGKVSEINSLVRMTLEKLLELPPIMFTMPVFCSGMFHSKSGKIGPLSIFCQ